MQNPIECHKAPADEAFGAGAAAFGASFHGAAAFRGDVLLVRVWLVASLQPRMFFIEENVKNTEKLYPRFNVPAQNLPNFCIFIRKFFFLSPFGSPQQGKKGSKTPLMLIFQNRLTFSRGFRASSSPRPTRPLGHPTPPPPASSAG